MRKLLYCMMSCAMSLSASFAEDAVLVEADTETGRIYVPSALEERLSGMSTIYQGARDEIEVVGEAVESAQSNLTAHADNTDNPHGVTAEQIGAVLGATINEPHTVETNDGIIDFTIGATGSGFPLTNNGDMAQFSLTNGLTVQATNGVFGALSGSTVNLGSGTVAGNWSVLGNLSVIGYSSNVNWIYVDYRTNVYGGTTTTYYDEVVYSTNIQYLNTIYYTSTVNTVTNHIDTFVNVGGSFEMGAASTFDATNAASVAFPTFTSTSADTSTVAVGTWDFTGATLLGLPAQGVTNIGSSMTGNGLETALDVNWGTATTTAMTNIDWASFGGGVTQLIINAAGQYAVTSTIAGAVLTVTDLPVPSGGGGTGWTNLAFSGTGNAITGATAAGTTLTLERGTIEGGGDGTSTNEVRAIRDEAFRTYTTLGLSGGTALVTRASGQWVMIEADDGAVTLDVDVAAYTNSLEAIRHQICWVRGTNETYTVITNNIDNTLFVDLPTSTTNHLFLERRPGWPRFQIWQDFR